jgi:hypothetical protein
MPWPIPPPYNDRHRPHPVGVTDTTAVADPLPPPLSQHPSLLLAYFQRPEDNFETQTWRRINLARLHPQDGWLLEPTFGDWLLSGIDSNFGRTAAILAAAAAGRFHGTVSVGADRPVLGVLCVQNIRAGPHRRRLVFCGPPESFVRADLRHLHDPASPLRRRLQCVEVTVAGETMDVPARTGIAVSTGPGSDGDGGGAGESLPPPVFVPVFALSVVGGAAGPLRLRVGRLRSGAGALEKIPDAAAACGVMATLGSMRAAAQAVGAGGGNRHVVSLLEPAAMASRGKLPLYFPWYALGDLRDAAARGFTLGECADILCGAWEGLRFLNTVAGFLHGDIKPANVFVDVVDGTCVGVIGDIVRVARQPRSLPFDPRPPRRWPCRTAWRPVRGRRRPAWATVPRSCVATRGATRRACC